MLEPWEGRKALNTHFLYLLSKRARKHVLQRAKEASERVTRTGKLCRNCSLPAPWSHVQYGMLVMTREGTDLKKSPFCSSLLCCPLWQQSSELKGTRNRLVQESSKWCCESSKGTRERHWDGIGNQSLTGAAEGHPPAQPQRPSHTNNRPVRANPTTNLCP